MSIFSEIKESKPESSEKSSFDPDKRVDVSGKETKGDVGKTEGFDPDKRIDKTDLQNKTYTDDNNKAYRVNDRLIPNNTYEINGYKYETDQKERIKSVEGKLQLKQHNDRLTIKDKMSDIGKGYEKNTDDRFHLIGDNLNGSNGMENMVAGDAKLNRGEYNKLEQQLAKAVSEGKDVYMKVDMNYPGKSFRPDSFLVNYSIDGEQRIKVFSNKPGGN